MRKGGSFNPKWSRYIRVPSRSGPLALLLLLRRFHAGVQRRAVDAEHLGRLTDVASRELHRGLDVPLFPGLEHLVEIEAALALKMALRLLDERSRMRRHFDRENRQPVIQVRAEVAFPDFLAQVAIGGGDHPGTGETLLRLADALELAVLEHAQELRLQLQGQLADLI